MDLRLKFVIPNTYELRPALAKPLSAPYFGTLTPEYCSQRKRVSIGIELVTVPMLLVLDEPTSGLDATSSLGIIKLLKSLSSLGVTVVCMIHQPRHEIFLSLDHVLFLARGRQVFFGGTHHAADCFRGLGYRIREECNPADAVLDIISGDTQRYLPTLPGVSPLSLEDLIAIWSKRIPEGGPGNGPDPAESGDAQAELVSLAQSASSHGASRCKQIYYYLIRSLKQQTRQVAEFFLEIVVGAIAGTMIGLSVYQLDGPLLQGIHRPPFELLSSSTNYTLVPELALLNILAIGWVSCRVWWLTYESV
jgi:hypothetical protein